MTFNVREVVETLKLEIVRERGSEILCHCPLHVRILGKEDHNPSFWINVETGANLCFSCGWKGSVFSLVGNVLELFDENGNVDYDAVKQWLANISEVTVEELSKRLNKVPDYVSLPPPIPMSEARLALFTEPPQWALDARGLTAEACRKYGVMWKKKSHQWILPLRDPYEFELMGWQEKFQKSDSSIEVTNHFMNRPVGLKKSKTLFGVQNMVKERAIVVESPLDAVRLESLGISGTVAVLGTVISIEQIKLLRQCDVVVSAFDNPAIDPAGRKASKEFLDLARKYGIELKFFNYNGEKGKDPGELSVEAITLGLKTAKDMIYGDRAYL